MNGITTHVLDTSRGQPAGGVGVRLERLDGDTWREIAAAHTGADGRARDLAAEARPGRYRLSFAVRDYFARTGATSFYHEVVVDFEIARAEHHHVPLLVSPWGYTTYRGS